MKPKIAKTFHNGFETCHLIYSENGMKIKEYPSGEPWDTDEKHTISVTAKRYDRGDYIETDEPIDPIKDTSKPIEPIEEVQI